MRIQRAQRQVLATSENPNTLINPGMFDREFDAQQGMGQAAAGAVFDVASKIRQTDMVREQADFIAAVNREKMAHRELMETNADFESYQPDLEGRMKTLDEISQKLKYPQTKNWAYNELKKNRPLWEFSTNQYIHRRTIDASLASFRESASTIAATDYKDEAMGAGVPETQFKQSMFDQLLAPLIESGALSREQAVRERLAFKDTMAKVEQAQAKQMFEAEIADIVAAYGYPAAVDYIKTQLPKLVKERGLLISDLNSLSNHLQSFAKIEEGKSKQAKLNLVEATKSEVHNILSLPPQSFLEQAPLARETINNSGLTADEKQKELAKIDNRVSALMKGEFDPLDEYSPSEYRRISESVMKNPKSVRETDITGGNLTPTQKQDLLDLKRKYESSDIEKATHETYRTAIKSLIAKNAFSTNDTQNIELGTRALIAFDQWAKQSRFPDEYQKFYEHLTSTTANVGWWTQVFSRKRTGLRKAAEMNIQDLEQGFEAKYQEGDILTRNGKIYKVIGFYEDGEPKVSEVR